MQRSQLGRGLARLTLGATAAVTTIGAAALVAMRAQAEGQHAAAGWYVALAVTAMTLPWAALAATAWRYRR